MALALPMLCLSPGGVMADVGRASRPPDIDGLIALSAEMAGHLHDVKANRQAYMDDFERFEAGPVALFFRYTSPTRTLVEIIGRARFEGFTPEERQALIMEMRETYRRYLYEFLYGGINISLSALKIDEQSAEAQLARSDMIAVKLRGEISGFPDITVTSYIAPENGEWRAFDFSFWGLRYSSGKRATFKRRLDRTGVNGLLKYMKKKNTDFFDGLGYRP